MGSKICQCFKKHQIYYLILSCSKPIFFLPSLNTLITQECSGKLLNQFLRYSIPIKKEKLLLQIFHNCGTWLRLFHECFANHRFEQDKIQKHLKRFKDTYEREPNKKLIYVTVCHNDFSPRNIFISPFSVEVIDYVNAKWGFPEEDIIFFENYILKAKFNFLYSNGLKKKMCRALKEGYGTID